MNYRTALLQIVPQLYYNQYETLLTIYFYYNSKFITGEYDAEGDKKYFYNIVRNPCMVYTKMIDFDTKDIKLLTADGADPLKMWYMNRDLKFWMKDKQFGLILNRITHELPIFGSCVLKEVQGELHFVDLRNFVVEPSADTLDDSNFIIEIHNYTVTDFRNMVQKMGWQDNVDLVINEWKQMQGRSHITILERYGEIENEETGEWEYRRIYMADVGVDRLDQLGALRAYNGVLLQSDIVTEHPYWEFHLEKIPGRWLGVGAVEILFDTQVKQNEIVNLQSKTSYWAALRIFQTTDQGVNRNLMTDVSNGEVLTVDSLISQVDMSDRNVQFFTEETNKWEKQATALTFDSPLMQGTGIPSGIGMRIGIAQLLSAASKAYFDQIKQNIGLRLKELLFEVILPRFQQESNPEHVLRIAGQDLDELQEMLINEKVSSQLVEWVIKNQRVPGIDEFNIMKMGIQAAVKQNKEHLLGIPKGFYKNLKYSIDIDITGESQDTKVYTAALFAALQAMTADPTLLQDPVKKKFFSKWLEANNINPDELLKANQMDINNQIVGQMMNGAPKGSGGGVSAPNFEGNNSQVQTL
jgi:hypothetical protein